jgi:hypothetical protein
LLKKRRKKRKMNDRFLRKMFSEYKNCFKSEDRVSDVVVLDASDRILERRLEVLVVFLEAGLVVVEDEAGQAFVDAVRLRETKPALRLK